jgi:rhodanese-related sulfurtransferase
MLNFIKKLFGPGINYNNLIAKGAIIIDVRTPQEFDNGHIKDSKNIPLQKIQSEVNKIKSWNKPIITVCQSGGRSSMAKSTLQNAGIEVYNGGGWMSLKSKLVM